MADTNLARKIRAFIFSNDECTEADVRSKFGLNPDFQETWEWMTNGGPNGAGFVVRVDSNGVCKKGPQWEFDKVGDYGKSYQNPCFSIEKNTTTRKEA